MSADLCTSKSNNPVFTTLSLPSSIAIDYTSDDLRETRGRHILWIDLRRIMRQDPQNDLQLEWEPSPKAEILLVENIRQFVRQDMQSHPLERIDSVRIDAEYVEEPTFEMWQALDGLSPKHLEVRAIGFDEGCDIVTLNTLRRQWKDLDTLSLYGLCCQESDELPQIVSQVSTLELIYCASLRLVPPGGLDRLKHLKIVENDAFDMFIIAFDRTPRFWETLETLDIQSTHSECDFRCRKTPKDFRNRIKQCVNLRKLRLSTGDTRDSILDDADCDLASHIPPSVEVLELEFTRSSPFLRDIDDWTSHAADINWLPRLKSVCVRINQLRVSQGRFIMVDLEFEKKKDVLYDLLRSTRPLIHLIN